LHNVLTAILGTEVFSTKEKYVMPVVDTAYIRSQYRNRGFGTEILSDVIARFPDEDIGFSMPISSGMLKSKCPISGYRAAVMMLIMMNPFCIVLQTFLRARKEYRLRFWEIADCDIAGSQQLIWCRLKKSSLRTKNS